MRDAGTRARARQGVIAIATGPAPTAIGPPAVLVAVLTGVTVLVTKTRRESG